MIKRPKSKSNAIKCANNLKTIGTWQTIYSAENKGFLSTQTGGSDAGNDGRKWGPRLMDTVAPSTNTKNTARVFYCPSFSTAPTEGSYFDHSTVGIRLYNGVSTIKTTKVEAPSKAAFIHDSVVVNDSGAKVRGNYIVYNRLNYQKSGTIDVRHGKTFNSLFIDGHVMPETKETEAALEYVDFIKYRTNANYWGPYTNRITFVD